MTLQTNSCNELIMQEETLNLLMQLLPLIIGTAVVPSIIILVILFLQSDRGLLKASAFVGGMVSWRLFMLTIFVYYSFIFANLFSLRIPERLHFALLSLLGIILMIVATYLLMKKRNTSGTSPNLLKVIDRSNAPMAFALGVVLMAIGLKHYIFMIGAMQDLERSGILGARWTLAMILFIVAAELLVLIPILIYLLMPDRSEAILGSFKNLLDKYSSTITITFCYVVGIFFLWRAFMLLQQGQLL
jgi:hypothetical protein